MTMQRVLLAVFALLAFAPAAQADFQAGYAAYQRSDFATALREWRPLAEAGDARAQYNLGILHAEGRGVPENAAEARAWWEKAAAQNYGPALHNLASLYLGGEGVPQDFATARGLLERAVKLDQANSLYTLGKMYAEGMGGPKDMTGALGLFQRAAALGHARAQYNLGKLYRDGAPGLAPDMGRAVEYFRLAAEQGHALAQSRLATRLAAGQGAPKDEVEALKWAILAAREGEESALGNEKVLRDRLPAAQVADAEARAAAFKPGPR
jgi:TPR repeat protein